MAKSNPDTRTVTLAHHYVDHAGVLGDAGKSYPPLSDHTVDPATATALAVAGLLVGVNPDDPAAVEAAGTTGSSSS